LSGYRVFVWVLLPCFVASCSSNLDSTKEVWNQYKKNYRNYHRKFYQNTVERWPELKAVAKLQKRYIFHRIRLRDLQIQFLLNQHPNELTLGHSVYDFVHFEWNDQYDTELFRSYENAEQLQRKVKRLKGELDNHSQLKTLRSRVQSLPEDSEFSALNKNFQSKLQQLNESFRRVIHSSNRSKSN